MNEKSVKENLSNMTLKEKFNYLLYYYKVHVIVFLLVVAGIGSFVYTEASKDTIYLDVSYIGGTIPDDTTESIQNTLTKALVPEDKSDIVQFNSYNLSNGNELTKVYASIAANEIDVTLMNNPTFEKYYEGDIFLDLDSIPGFSSLNIDDDSLVKKDGKVYGIKTKNLTTLGELNKGGNNDMILSVISNTKNLDKVIPLLNSCGIN